jgi:hypothetical protein
MCYFTTENICTTESFIPKIIFKICFDVQEGNFLFVLGGSLGKLSGYTDSVEMYSVETGQWLEGPKMSSSRYSHCAVGLGNGSIIVTGQFYFEFGKTIYLHDNIHKGDFTK